MNIKSNKTEMINSTNVSLIFSTRLRRIYAISAIALSIFSCGQKKHDSSNVKDVVDPVGPHQQHYSGKVRIEGPGQRKFPDAFRSFIHISYESSIGRVDEKIRSSEIEEHESLDISARPLKGREVVIDLEGDPIINNIPLAPKFEPSEQNFIKTNKLRRIDVNHVLLSRPDGTRYFASGSYQIFAKDCDNFFDYTDRLPTKTGVDVPSDNLYKVVTDARNEDGTNVRHEAILDYRDL